jgi:hypothetical protein
MQKTIIYRGLLVSLYLVSSCAVAKDITSPTWFYDLHYYKYEEPGLMNEKSSWPSVTLGYRNLKSLQQPNAKDFSGQAEVTLGLVKYSGSGTLDTSYSKLQLEAYYPVYQSFYVGLGYRRLMNPMGGELTSTGAAGYDRLSQYFYMPIGKAFDSADGTLKAQFNVFLRGKQTSYFTQISGYGNDLENTQDKGYGLDISYAPKAGFWEIYWRYWNIADSDSVNVYLSNGSLYGTGKEPKNTTNELGIRFAF